MISQETLSQEISPWWLRAFILTLLICFGIQVWIACLAYQGAPPIPDRVINQAGETLFTGNDILSGQQVFLKYGLMENGSIWGHGAYLGPDFSAAYLHTLGVDTGLILGQSHFGRALQDLPLGDQGIGGWPIECHAPGWSGRQAHRTEGNGPRMCRIDLEGHSLGSSD